MINSIFVCTKLKVTAKARRQGQSHGFHSTIFFRCHGNNGRRKKLKYLLAYIYECERKFPSRATFHLELKINFSSLLKNLLFLARSNPNHLKHIYLHPFRNRVGMVENLFHPHFVFHVSLRRRLKCFCMNADGSSPQQHRYHRYHRVCSSLS